MTSLVQQIASNVIPVVATVASTGILALMGVGFKWMIDHTKNERVKAILQRVSGQADATVRNVSNTLLDDLKKAGGMPGGVLSPEARVQLKTEAISQLKTTLGQVTVDKVRTTLGFTSDAELIAFLNAQVEKAVSDMKIEKLAVTAAAPVVQVAKV